MASLPPLLRSLLFLVKMLCELGKASVLPVAERWGTDPLCRWPDDNNGNVSQTGNAFISRQLALCAYL